MHKGEFDEAGKELASVHDILKICKHMTFYYLFNEALYILKEPKAKNLNKAKKIAEISLRLANNTRYKQSIIEVNCLLASIEIDLASKYKKYKKQSNYSVPQ
jgi:hypothetical protein